MVPSRKIQRIADKLGGTLVEIRRDLHKHPETGFSEKRTSAKVAEVLNGLGLDVRAGVGKTGVVALLRGRGSRKTVALRADMDALPLQEENNVPYRSVHDGVMHACGHDAHTAMALGAAMILTELKEEVGGAVKFLFQPAEEIVGGAPAMIADDALKSPKPDVIFGAHLRPDIPFGSVGACVGPMMAGANHFRVEVSGSSGHGAAPFKAVDPLVPAHQIYQAVQTLERTIDALQPFVISICSFHGGSTYNIIPEKVEMKGTMRAFDNEVRESVQARLRRIVKHVGDAFGVKCRLDIEVGCPSVSNDEKAVEIVRRSAEDLKMSLREADRTMGSEDFAYYLEHAPGVMYRLGTQTETPPRVLHHCRFDFDERILPMGAALMARCALRYLGDT